jgi:hypothetical protein
MSAPSTSRSFLAYIPAIISQCRGIRFEYGRYIDRDDVGRDGLRVVGGSIPMLAVADDEEVGD